MLHAKPDEGLAEMAQELLDAVRHVDRAIASITDDEDAATEAADEALAAERRLERSYYQGMAALLEVEDMRERIARRELYRRCSRIGETVVEVASGSSTPSSRRAEFDLGLGSRRGAVGGWKAGAAGLPHVATGCGARLPRRLLRPRLPRLSHLSIRSRRSPTASSIRAGRSVFTGDDIRDGPEGLPQATASWSTARSSATAPTSGPDFTADYLHRSSASVRNQLGWQRVRLGAPGDDRPVPDQPLRLRRPTRCRSAAQQARAFGQLREALRATSSRAPPPSTGCGPRPIKDPQQIHQLTAFFAWSAWAASARGPGHNYSYTNNWPPEEQVGNAPSADVIVWSVISLIALLGGHRDPVRGLRALADGVAGPRPGDAQLPRSRRRRADSRPAGHRLVLLRDGGAVLAPDPGRGHGAALPRRARRLLRHRRRPGVPLQPGPHLARAAGDLLRRHLVRCRRHLPDADDRRPRAARARASSRSASSARWPSSSSGA